ncbi:MAG: hypothetical protein P4L22_00385 [Candidatus Babeliales bacterium]|nr:hypothetical protein [Candidatus Babeliales bacterium]
MKKLIYIITLVIISINAEDAFKTPIIADRDCSTNEQDKNDIVFGKTFYSTRPQDSNTARKIMRFIPNKLYYDSYYDRDASKLMNLCVEYQKSFNSFSPKLAEWFLKDCKQCLTLGPSDDTHCFDINSTQFGLLIPENKPSTICLSPKIDNLIIDFGIGFDLSRFICNLWTKMNLVFARCKTSIDLTTCGGSAQTGMLPPCVYSNNCKPEPVPYKSICSALVGNQGQGSFPPLKFGKLTNSQSESGVASIIFDLGYDLIRRERGHLGANLHIVFPTGNRPNAQFLFEPIVGANKCWQVGLGVNSSYDLYCSCDTKVGLYMDSILSHLFKSNQTRLFNLKSNGPLSQYLLLKKFDAQGDAYGIDRVANILAGETKIGADIMFDGSLMLQVNRCNFFANIGYNLWVRTKEKRDDSVCFRDFLPDTFGIKGNLPLCTSVTMSCECPLTDLTADLPDSVKNDLPSMAALPNPDCTPVNETLCQAVNTTASKSTISCPAQADAETTYLKISDINFNAPLHPTAISNKIFGSIGYNYDTCRFPIYCLIGAEVEFSNGNKAINQWGVLAKAGITF